MATSGVKESGVKQRIIQVTPAILIVDGMLRRSAYSTKRGPATRLGQVYPLGPCLVLLTETALPSDYAAWQAITESRRNP